MKTHLRTVLITAGIALAGTHAISAATLLDDHFDDGDITTNPATGGGFVFQDNAQNPGTGSVSESGSLAAITEGSGNNTTGIRSSNAFDLSDSGLTYTATWEVANWTLAASGTVRRMTLALQTNDDWLFNGGVEESRILVEINKVTNKVFLRYQKRSGGANANVDSQTFDLGSVGDDTDGFTATLVMDSSGFSFTTLGLNATNEVNLADTWANMGTDFTTVFGTDGPMHVAAYIQDTGRSGSTLDIDRIILSTMGSAPTPILLKIFRNGGNLNFEWNSQAGKIYKLVTSTDMSSPISSWPIYDDGVKTYDNIAPAGTGTKTLLDVVPLGPTRFFSVIEE